LVVLILVAIGTTADGQQAKKVARIGFLTGASLSSQAARNEAFRQGLRDLGYVEGKDIIIDWRSYEGKAELRSSLAAELVHLKVDVIVAGGSADIQAAKEATSTIPIVMIAGGDAVASGFVASLARPGGNVTGFSTFRPELGGKRLELLKETVTRLAGAAFIASSSNRDYSHELKELELAAKKFRIKLQRIDVQSAKDIEPAFQAAAKGRAGGVLFRVAGPYEAPYRSQIAQLAVKHRLPTIHESALNVDAGGLMSYGVGVTDLGRGAAVYVDKILKGRTPADLPVEQPMKFEFVVNLQAAKKIGLTIPPNVLVRADRVIR
jgi:putative ABC transport system substrate-binding protein